MTFKKSMISIAAAGVIAAGLTGCGSDDSTPVNNDTAPSSFEAVDGKIMNALATAYYVNDKNETVGVKLNRNVSSQDLVTDVISKGDYTYSLPSDADITADDIRYVEINGTTVDTTTMAGSKIFASFIDVDGNNEYNSSVDQAFTGSLIAPKGMKYITPVSTIIANNAGLANLKAADYNATIIENAVKLIAAKLNLTADTIANTDPSASGAEEYGMVNAYLADAKDNAGALATAIAAIDANSTTFAGVVGQLTANGTATTKALFKTIDTMLTNGSLTTADLASINVDKSRAAGGTPVVNSKNDAAIADISAIKVDGENASDLLSTGDKVKTGLISFTFPDADDQNSDTNASTTVDLVISLSAAESKVEDTAGTEKLVVKLNNIGIKNVDGTVSFDANESIVTTSYEFFTNEADANDTYVSKNDVNSTVVNGFGSISGDTINISTLLSAVNSDLTKETNATTASTPFYSNKIVDLMAVIVDSDSALQTVDASGNAALWSTSKVEGSVDAFDATGKMVLNLRADMRTGNTATGANAAPYISAIAQNSANVEAIVHLAANGTVTADEHATALSGATLVVNDIDAGNITQFLTPTVNQNGNTGELNDSVTITGLPSWVTVANSGTKNGSDLNLTIDGNATVTGHDLTMATVSVKDEFNEVNTSKDLNVSFMFNHAPTIAAATVAADINVTTTATATTITTTVSDEDMADMNSSVTGGLESITITGAWDVDGNPAIVANNAIASLKLDDDDNATAALATPTIGEDGSITWVFTTTIAGGNTLAVGEDSNATIEYKVTDIYGAQSEEQNVTFNFTVK